MAENEEESNGEQGKGKGKGKGKSGGGFRGKLNKTENAAKNFEKATGKLANKASSYASKHTGTKAAEMAGKTATKMAKMSANAGKVAAKASATAAKISGVVAAAWPVILAIIIIVLVIFIVTGLLTYLLSAPGVFWGKIKEIAKNVGNAVYATWYSNLEGEEGLVKAEDVNNMADYLDQMGYDLFGYGFITKPAEFIFNVSGETSDEEIEEAKQNAVSEIDSEVNIDETSLTDESDDKDIGTGSTHSYELKSHYHSSMGEDYIKKSASNLLDLKYMVQYLISDNYAYMLKNSNGHGLYKAFNVAVFPMASMLIGPVGAYFAIKAVDDKLDAKYGTGLINIVDEDGKTMDVDRILAKDYAYIENGQLCIKPSRVSKRIWTYDLDSFTTQYGMPLEFLESVHIATMAPDLSYKLTTLFNTNVNIKMVESDGKLERRVSTAKDGVVIDDDNDTSWTETYMSAKDAFKFMKKHGITSLTEEDLTDEETDTGKKFICLGYPREVDDSAWEDGTDIMSSTCDVNNFISSASIDSSKLTTQLENIRVKYEVEAELFNSSQISADIIEGIGNELAIDSSKVSVSENEEDLGDEKSGKHVYKKYNYNYEAERSYIKVEYILEYNTDITDESRSYI